MQHCKSSFNPLRYHPLFVNRAPLPFFRSVDRNWHDNISFSFRARATAANGSSLHCVPLVLIGTEFGGPRRLPYNGSAILWHYIGESFKIRVVFFYKRVIRSRHHICITRHFPKLTLPNEKNRTLLMTVCRVCHKIDREGDKSYSIESLMRSDRQTHKGRHPPTDRLATTVCRECQIDSPCSAIP